jgi:hypothetical protein
MIAWHTPSSFSGVRIGGLFNREYHRRAARQALAKVGLIVLRDENSGFYRPAIRPDPRPKAKEKLEAAGQMALRFEAPADAEHPLRDIFPTAYED